MGKCPLYAIAECDESSIGEVEKLVLKDLGEGQDVPTITNGAEEVIADLAAHKWLLNRPRVMYYDSSGVMDTELLHDGEKFLGFKPLPTEEIR